MTAILLANLLRNEVDSSGNTTVTTDNGAGTMTESSGDEPVEIDAANGDAVGTVQTYESGSEDSGSDDSASDDGDSN